MDADEIRELSEQEQALAKSNEEIPRLVRHLYVNSMREGFTEAQAFELVKTFLMAMFQRPKE